MNYMILNIETGNKFFINPKSVGVNGVKQYTSRNYINQLDYRCAVYRENTAPRWMRDGKVEEFGKRWVFTGLANVENQQGISRFVD